ncbi:MAG: hypothetical protein ACRYGM_14545 [Janthinobacterium lividum]
MSDARWLEVEDDLQEAEIHFSRSLELFAAGGFEADTLDAYRAQMALMHAMQSGHTSMESMLVRILGLLNEDAPSGSGWHADLIARARRDLVTRPAILSSSVAAAANETRRFRHVAMRNYGKFELSRSQPALEAARVIAAGLRADIIKFRTLIDEA